MRILTDPRSPRSAGSAGRLPGGAQAVVVDGDRLAPKRLLPEIDIRLPALLQLLELAKVNDGPCGPAIAFGNDATIGNRNGREPVTDCENEPEASFDQHQQNQRDPQDRPACLEARQQPPSNVAVHCPWADSNGDQRVKEKGRNCYGLPRFREGSVRAGWCRGWPGGLAWGDEDAAPRGRRKVGDTRLFRCALGPAPSPALRAPSPRGGEGEKRPGRSWKLGASDTSSPSPRRGEGWGEGAAERR